ncbi:MAG TPA: hypothetical protein VHO70_08500 [Chitinispirillaceae bacterium]|nr:hypothetical protein [Chitinispirillaceae bacterium]
MAVKEKTAGLIPEIAGESPALWKLDTTFQDNSDIKKRDAHSVLNLP